MVMATWMYLTTLNCNQGFPDGASGKEPTCQCKRHKRHGFDPWVGRSPGTHSRILAWRMPWSEEPQSSYSPWGLKESDTNEVT